MGNRIPTLWCNYGLFILFVCSALSSARAEIIVKGNTLLFKRDNGRLADRTGAALTRPDPDSLRKIERFQNELIIDRPVLDIGQRSALFLISTLKRRVIQGIRFAVPKNRKFAVVMSYYCTMKEYGAEFPFSCKSSVFIADPAGQMLGSTTGNYLYIQVHEKLPYFILMEDTCCDAPVRSAFFRLNGPKLCDIPNHRDPAWVNKTEVKCLDTSTGKPVTVELAE